jgi:hypothetical protein
MGEFKTASGEKNKTGQYLFLSLMALISPMRSLVGLMMVCSE